MNKKRKVAAVAGEQDTTFGFRISSNLSERVKRARTTGIPVAAANIVRPFLEHYADFTEANGKQPNGLQELYAWVLKRDSKKK